jgi:hypothetical protein
MNSSIYEPGSLLKTASRSIWVRGRCLQLGDIEAGRPLGLKRGTPLDAPFVLNFAGLTLQPGGYVWQLEVDEEVKASAPF